MKSLRKASALLALSAMIVSSMGMTVFADETKETTVKYTGEYTENQEYIVTVPEELAPGETGDVKLTGVWTSDMTVNVTAPETVVLTNDIDGSTKELAVTFEDISQAGSTTEAIDVTETIAVANITDALVGTWEGTITYNVTTETASEEIEYTQLLFSWSPSDGYETVSGVSHFVKASDTYITKAQLDAGVKMVYTAPNGATSEKTGMGLEYDCYTTDLISMNVWDTTDVTDWCTETGFYVSTASSSTVEIGGTKYSGSELTIEIYGPAE